MKKCETCYLINAKPCYECSACAGGDDHYKYWPNTQTNADCIRAMSDKELAEFLQTVKCRGAAAEACDEFWEDDSYEIDWLQQPVKEE